MVHMPQVNYLAVLVSGVVIFILGGVWYSPALFAKKWIALQGRTEEEMKAASRPMPVLLLIALVCGTLGALGIAAVLNHYNDPFPSRGVMVGAYCWALFSGASSFTNYLFSQRKFALWVIDSGFNLVSYLIAGAILGAWR